MSGVKKFIDHYKKMSNSTAVIFSSVHSFGSHVLGRTVTSVKGGSICRGRRIPVQAAATGRRKYGSKGKSPATAAERPLYTKQKRHVMFVSSYYNLLCQHQPKGKRPHNLALNVSKGSHNVGKW